MTVPHTAYGGRCDVPRDHAARAAGMVVEQVALGSATVTMTVRRDMVNGHDICHGGYMALLCDTAFAYACNACNQNTERFRLKSSPRRG